MLERNAPRIMIWKYEDAPAEWRTRRGGSGTPEWLALIPASLGGPDLDEAMRSRFDNTTTSYYETAAGDRVVVGISALRPVFELIAEYQSSQ